MEKEQAFKIELPKWPQCVINGEKITKEQALEIIRRTDEFFFGREGNNREFNKAARKICKMGSRYDFYDSEEEQEVNRKVEEEFEPKWGLVETIYIFNDWISCAWVGGYHGWCHPDGTIAFCNNIGKYPEVEEVYDDLCVLGEAFPFLKLTCTLMNGEEDYCTESLVTMRLENGKVEFLDPISYNDLEFNGIKGSFGSNRSENYFGLDQIQKWADEVYGQ